MQIGQPGCQVVGAVRGRGAEGAHHEHRNVVAGLHDVRQQPERVDLRPVEVVEEEDQRKPSSSLAERCRYGLVQLLTGGRPGRGGSDLISHVLGQMAQMMAHLLDDVVGRAAGRVGEEVVEDLGERAVGDSRVRSRCPEQYACPLFVCDEGGLSGQASLPYSRFTPDEDGLALTLFRQAPRPLQRLALLSPTHQRNLTDAGQAGRKRENRPRRHVPNLTPGVSARR